MKGLLMGELRLIYATEHCLLLRNWQNINKFRKCPPCLESGPFISFNCRWENNYT